MAGNLNFWANFHLAQFCFQIWLPIYKGCAIFLRFCICGASLKIIFSNFLAGNQGYKVVIFPASLEHIINFFPVNETLGGVASLFFLPEEKRVPTWLLC